MTISDKLGCSQPKSLLEITTEDELSVSITEAYDNIPERWHVLRENEPLHGFIVATSLDFLTSALRHYTTNLPSYKTFPVVCVFNWDGKENSHVANVFKEFPQYAHAVMPASYIIDNRPWLHDRSVCLFLDGERFPFLRKFRDFSELWYGNFHAKPFYLSEYSFNLGYLRIRPTPGLFLNNLSSVVYVYSRLADNESRLAYLAKIKTLENGTAYYTRKSFYPQYKHPIVQAHKEDVVIEGGVFDAKTTIDFSKAVGPSGKVIAFEPVKSFYDTCVNNTAAYDNISIENFGLSSHPSTAYISPDAGGSSKITNMCKANSLPCQLIDLDSYAVDRNISCDLVKLDVEGAELSCLEGAMRTIHKFRPQLQICIYHSPMDHFTLPILLMQSEIPYDYYIGQHTIWWSETVLYARPRK